MAAEETTPTPPETDAKPAAVPEAERAPEPAATATPKKSDQRPRRPASKAAGEKPAKAAKGPKAPNRPTLDPELARLLTERRAQDRRRPLFVRTASHRYYSIGRWASWRRPRGQQSKQRRHYGYRPTVVSIGFGSPRRTRGLTPSGFRPVLVRTAKDIEHLDASTQAALIARTIGTRQRLVLEEVARTKGIHVLNPLVRERPGGK